jgi:hypothetical protein
VDELLNEGSETIMLINKTTLLYWTEDDSQLPYKTSNFQEDTRAESTHLVIDMQIHDLHGR